MHFVVVQCVLVCTRILLYVHIRTSPGVSSDASQVEYTSAMETNSAWNCFAKTWKQTPKKKHEKQKQKTKNERK